MSSYAVYVLRDEVGAIRYVGITTQPEHRLSRHVREARARKTHRHNWIMSLIDRGALPTLEVVEWAPDWDEAERRWVEKLKAEGCDLVNGNDGGLTMHQVRKSSERYPAIKRMYRVLERNRRCKYSFPKTREKFGRILFLYCQLVSKHRQDGTLAWLNQRLGVCHGNS